MYTRIIINHR